MGHNYKRMDIWTDSMALVNEIYDVTVNFPPFEVYSLASQMQRAAVSVPSNIAEGAGKGSDKDFAHFLSHSLGSLYELETQLLIAAGRKYFSQECADRLLQQTCSLQKRVSAFREKLISTK